MIAVLSDIHGNLEAFQAVLADIASCNIEKIYIIGDIVGYGPNPLECVELAEEHATKATMGNHEIAVFTSALGFNDYAREAIDWTRAVLRPSTIGKLFKSTQAQSWNYLRELPAKIEEEDALFVHGSPRDPVMEYLPEQICRGEFHEDLDDNFALISRLCFIGHTHRPGIITEHYAFIHLDCIELEFPIPEAGKIFINVGSVGQPRDKNPQACYAIYDKDAQMIRFRRVEYDYQSTIDKMHKIPTIDDRLGDRLATGT